jgi:2-hydroxy-6-oxonona-2,4-dienedioate hydrolase
MRTIRWVSLAALIIAAASVFTVFRWDMADAHARLVGRSQTVETSFGTMEYAVLGEGMPILTIHGAGGGFDQGLDLTSAMTDHGYQLIAPSRFGYLRSALPNNLTTAMQADAYADLLDRLGIGKVVVIGSSAGAWSALQFAIRHPQRCRALVLLAPAGYLPVGTNPNSGAVVRAIFSSDFLAWAALKMMPVVPGGMSRMLLGTDAAIVRAAEPDEEARVARVLIHLLPVSPRDRGMQFDIKTVSTHEPYPIAKITCPVLAISAEDDRFGTAIRAREIAGQVVDGRAIIFPTGGHALVGHYAEAMREIATFLASHPPRLPPG